MTRSALPFAAPDLSALARFLERTLADHHFTHGRLPGHVEMMNLLARSIGKRNLQALQADAAAQATALARERHAAAPVPPPIDASVTDAWFDAPAIVEAPAAPSTPPMLSAHARKALEHFDAAGRLARWPLKFSVQRLAMWVLWTRFDGRRVYTEAEVNHVLKAWHLYGDHATLRRELINHRLMARKADCSEYRKLAVQPDDEVQALLQALRATARQRTGRRTARPRATGSSRARATCRRRARTRARHRRPRSEPDAPRLAPRRVRAPADASGSAPARRSTRGRRRARCASGPS